MKPLNPQQERFCQEYLIDLNGTDAYLRSGYKVKSKDVAKAAAARLLANVNVQARVAELQEARAARVQFTADQVLAELKILGLSDIRHYVMGDAAHPVQLAAEAPLEAMRAISTVKRRVRWEREDDEEPVMVEDIEYRLWDKPAALRMAGQHLGMFKEIHELTGKDGEAIPIEVRDAQGTLRSRIGRLADRLTTGSDLTAPGPNGNGRRSSPA